MQRNQTIDFMKLIMSISIIAIHSQIFGHTSPILYYTITMGLLRIAVPLFFVISGYYYYQKLQKNQSTKQYLLHLFKIFLVFEGIELLLYTPFMIHQLQGINIIFYLWKAISVGLGGAYWYIISLLLSLLILTPLWKKTKIIPMLLIGFIIYLCVFTVDSYAGFFTDTNIQALANKHTYIWTWPQAGLCSSLFYLSLGAFIYKYQPKIKIHGIWVIISLLFLMIEAWYLQRNIALDANCYLSLFICIPTIFIYLLQHPYLPFNTHKLGKMSLYIYMIHTIVLTILRTVLPSLGQNLELLFIVATFISLLISYFIVSLLEDKNDVINIS